MASNQPCNDKENCTGMWCGFREGKPEYLVRHYWWAYLWHWGVCFFDHQPIINAILFGQYKTLSHRSLDECMKDRPAGRVLQLTCAYGSMTPSLLRAMDEELYLMDVADIQLTATQKKLNDAERNRLLCARMNAEYLAYGDNVFATVLIFFLLHELPPDARERALSEAIRVLQPGGRFVITEYGETPKKNLLWRFPLTRWVLKRLEPFLASFWQVDLLAMLQEHAKNQGKVIRQVSEFHCFSDFYRVCSYEILSRTQENDQNS